MTSCDPTRDVMWVTRDPTGEVTGDPTGPAIQDPHRPGHLRHPAPGIARTARADPHPEPRESPRAPFRYNAA